MILNIIVKIKYVKLEDWMEKTNLYAYISFTGNDDIDDFPTEVVTEMLGVEPTAILR